ncbi:excalibur calcium-binding domain-containing protein [Pseudomonas sp. CFBP 8758]|uniref:excalibur calcium-binding domain-containing protein n=1 Tax=Pseudomonas sp. CFBP 8758 TaxID=2775286 RepID=UPI00313BACD5
MKTIVWLLVVAAVAWKFFPQIEEWLTPKAPIEVSNNVVSPTPLRPAASRPSFNCDGRQYCSQMTSCAEAKAFLKNCPGMKMDGNYDGIPCETQWCK